MSTNYTTSEELLLKDYEDVKYYSKMILDNIDNSELQAEYRKYLTEFRFLSDEALKEAHMFYITDNFYELDRLISNAVIKEILGIQKDNFITQKFRFVFPILDAYNTVLGFIGYDYDQPKYKYMINVGTFTDKTKLFYNKQHINKAYEEGIVIVEEGIADSINLNSTGLYNNLSMMGSYMTEHHARVLNRMDLLILIPDNDEPGQVALKNWVRMITTNYVIINIKKHPIKKKYMDEDGQVKEIDTFTKDLDDVFRLGEHKKAEFLELYHNIKKMKDSPFIKGKKFSF